MAKDLMIDQETIGEEAGVGALRVVIILSKKIKRNFRRMVKIAIEGIETMTLQVKVMQ